MKKKHADSMADSMNDALILELVKTLNGRTYEFEKQMITGWEIYCIDPLYFEGKSYRLVWCLHLDEGSIGVINAFRRNNRDKVSK